MKPSVQTPVLEKKSTDSGNDTKKNAMFGENY
jgi:hypothetical protein